MGKERSVKGNKKKGLGVKNNQFTNKQSKKREETKPKKSFTKHNASIPAARFKNKTSKVSSILATGSRVNGRKLLSSKQVQQGKETIQYKASTKKIKQMRREGIPKKAIEAMLRNEKKSKKGSKSKRNARVGLE